MEMDPASHMSQPLLVFWAYAKWKPALLPATVNKTENYILSETKSKIMTRAFYFEFKKNRCHEHDVMSLHMD